MAKGRILNMVATECVLENDAKFNKWYNEVHIPMIMKYQGIKKVTRYKVIEEKQPRPKYLAVYEYDNIEDLRGQFASPEFKAVREEMQTTWKGNMPDVTWTMTCVPIKTWEK